MDYTEMLPELFVGSYPQGIGEIDRLKRETGVTAVLSLQTDDDLRHLNVDWDELTAYYAACEIELRRIPIRDGDPVDLQVNLPESVKLLDELMSAGHTVYVHCTAGSGRAPSVVVAYLVWHRNWDLDEAATYVKQRRVCSPNIDAVRRAVETSIRRPL